MSPEIYRIYLRFRERDVLLPQTPSKITISNEDKTEVVSTADGRPFTIPHYDGPQKIEFEFDITCKDYPFTFKDAQEGIRFYTDLMWDIKAQKGPIGITIIRSGGQPYTDMRVLLQDYSYVEDAENANDYTFSVTFMDYYTQTNHEASGSGDPIGRLVKADKNFTDWKWVYIVQGGAIINGKQRKDVYQDSRFLAQIMRF